MPRQDFDLSQAKIPVSVTAAAYVGILCALWAIATWAYENLAGSKDVDGMDQRISRVVTFIKEVDAKQTDERKTLEARLLANIANNQTAQLEVNREILNRLNSIDSFLRNNPRKALYTVDLGAQ